MLRNLKHTTIYELFTRDTIQPCIIIILSDYLDYPYQKIDKSSRAGHMYEMNVIQPCQSGQTAHSVQR